MKVHIGSGKRRFTLIELLVVVAIIVILIGMLMPAISKAKSYANSIYCRNNLRELGIAFQSYMTDYKDNMPLVAAMPSLGISDPEYQRLCDVLAPFVGGAMKVFRCPSDYGAATPGLITNSTDDDGNAVTGTVTTGATGPKSDFENEGSSYEFNEFLCGRRITNKPKVMMMHDYRPYHGSAGLAGAANYLFADGHVGDWN